MVSKHASVLPRECLKPLNVIWTPPTWDTINQWVIGPFYKLDLQDSLILVASYSFNCPKWMQSFKITWLSTAQHEVPSVSESSFPASSIIKIFASFVSSKFWGQFLSRGRNIEWLSMAADITSGNIWINHSDSFSSPTFGNLARTRLIIQCLVTTNVFESEQSTNVGWMSLVSEW